MLPGLAVDSHAARLQAGKDLRDFVLIEGLDLLQRGGIVTDAADECGAGGLLRAKMGKAVENVAEGEFVGVAEIGIAFEAREKRYGQRGVQAGGVSAKSLFQIIEAVEILLEENPGSGAHALAVAFVQGRGVVHEHDDLAVGRNALIHAAGDRGRGAVGGSGLLHGGRLRRSKDSAEREDSKGG